MFADVFGGCRPLHWHGLLGSGHVCGGMRTVRARCRWRVEETAGAAQLDTRDGTGNGTVSVSKATSQQPSESRNDWNWLG